MNGSKENLKPIPLAVKITVIAVSCLLGIIMLFSLAASIWRSAVKDGGLPINNVFGYAVMQLELEPYNNLGLGDLFLAKIVKPQDIKVGYTIVYYNGYLRGTVPEGGCIAKVTEVNERGGVLYFATETAPGAQNGEFSEICVVGVYAGNSGLAIGYLTFSSTVAGLICLIIVPAALLFALDGWLIFRESKRNRLKQLTGGN